MGVMNEVGEALLGQHTTKTTPRQDNEAISADHESSTSDDEMKGNEKGEVAKKGLSEKSTVYLDESAGTEIEWLLSKENPGVVEVENIPKVLNSIINKELILDGSSQNEGDMSLEGSSNKGNLKIDLVQDDEEEVLELEFERAVEKMHTHNIYCPNCSFQVTRVILRRKKPHIKDPRHKPMGLLGCLSCLSIFIPSGNTLNPFPCFGRKKSGITPEPPLPASISDNDEPNVKKGRVFDLSWIFRKKDGNDVSKTLSSEPGKDLNEHEEGDLDEPLRRTKSRLHPQHETPPAVDDQDDINKGDAHDQHQPPLGELPQVSPPGSDLGGDQHIIEFPQTQVPLVSRPSGSGYFEHGSKSLEILKSIVYGGLVESITSLSIVTSAAASETATMNIVAIGLANVTSGVFIVAHNLRGMKNETPIPNSNEQTDRYQKLIGKRDNFLLHFTFAILSFLLFGLIPPAVYVFAFEKTDNKDYTIIVVAIASLICIILLSIGKAYCNGEHKFSTYIKTISYYLSNAVAVSGVAYAMGDLIKIVVEKLGWFVPTTPTPATLVNYGVNSGTTFMASS